MDNNLEYTEASRNGGVPQNAQSTTTRQTYLVWLIALAAVLLVAAGGAYYYFGPLGSVATVNGEKISRSAFNTRMEQARAQLTQNGTDLTDPAIDEQLSGQVLAALVNEALLLQAAKAAGISATENEIAAVLEQNKNSFDTDDAYNQALSSQGFTEKSFRDFIEAQLVIRAYAEQELNLSSLDATEDEIQQLYAQATGNAQDAPSLGEVRQQVEAQIIQQKSQLLLSQLIDQLRITGSVEIRI